MFSTFADGTIEYFIDQECRVVFGRWEGDIRGDELVATLPALWRDYPEIGRFSAIHDMIDFTGMLEHRFTREMIRLRNEHVPDFSSNVRTAIVTADRMKTLELKVTQASAPDRQFHLFGSNAAALEWVMANEPGNPSVVTGRRSGVLPWWFDRESLGGDADAG